MMSKPKADACRASFAWLRAEIARDIQDLVKNSMFYDSVPVGDDTFDAGVFLLCGLIQTGPDARYISRLTGLPRQRCCWFGIQARRHGIFSKGGVFAGPWMDNDQLTASMNFTLDAMVVAGRIRCKGNAGPDRLYMAL